MATGKLFPFVLVGALLVSAPAFPQAVMLFDNGPMDYVNGHEMTMFTEAEDFEVPFSAQATRVSIGMGEFCAFPGSWDNHLRWWIYEDSGGLPGPLVATSFAPAVSYTLDLDNCPGIAWWDVWFPLGQVVDLTVGVRYWLAIHMAADWAIRDEIYWATTSPGNFSRGAFQLGGTGPWASLPDDLAFNISFVSDDTYIFVDGFASADTSIWSTTVP
jgi:hypothetical protein